VLPLLMNLQVQLMLQEGAWQHMLKPPAVCDECCQRILYKASLAADVLRYIIPRPIMGWYCRTQHRRMWPPCLTTEASRRSSWCTHRKSSHDTGTQIATVCHSPWPPQQHDVGKPAAAYQTCTWARMFTMLLLLTMLLCATTNWLMDNRAAFLWKGIRHCYWFSAIELMAVIAVALLMNW